MSSRGDRSRVFVWVAIAALAGPLGTGACQRREVTPEVPEARRQGERAVTLSEVAERNGEVVAERVPPGRYAPKTRVFATIEADPRSIARVGTRAAGRVMALRVTHGQAVRAGEALIEIDTLELHQVSTEYLTALARASAADAAFQRQLALVPQGAASGADLERARAEEAAARANLNEAEEHLHVLGLRDPDIARIRSQSTHGAGWSVLRAPMDGRVNSIDVTVGQVLSGDEVVITIARLDALWAVMRVSERDVMAVAPGARVELRAAASPEREVTAIVSFVSDTVDARTRTVEVRARIDPPPEGVSLRHGMSATAMFERPGDPSVRALPVEAVRREEERAFVFVREAPRRYVVREVVAGEERGGVVPVTRGLRDEDEVVVRGAFALHGELARDELSED